MKPITRLLLMLPGARQNGNAWSAYCPAHIDSGASLSITEGTDGRAHLDCRAGCKPDAICSAVGLRASDIASTARTLNHGDAPQQNAQDVVATVNNTPRRALPDTRDGMVPSMRPAEAPTRPPQRDARAMAAAPGPNRPGTRQSVEITGVRLSTVEPRPVRWLWPGRIALGKLTIISGDPGLGKSFLSCDLAARISTGREWPDNKLDNGPDGRTTRAPSGSAATTPGNTAPSGSAATTPGNTAPSGFAATTPGNTAPSGSAAMTPGNPAPSGSAATTPKNTAPRGSVILLNCEDDLEDTIRPRLDRHGADVSRIIALTAVREPLKKNRERQFDLARDLAALEVAIRQVGDCRLVVIDPVTAYLGNRHDSHKTADVRALLAPLAALAARHDVAVVAISHLNKGSGAAIYRTTGSLAFVAAARAAWCVTRDPENPDRRMFLPIKNNLGNDATGLAYSIVDGRIRWEADPVTTSANDALAAERQSGRRKRGPDAEAHGAASAWLLSALAGGPRPTKELFDEWTNGQAGCKRTLERAKQSLAVEAFRPTTPGPWWWRLAGNTAKTVHAKQLGDLGGLA